jgi:hypothetical protein
MMMREDCEKGFFVSFDYSSDALQEIESFFKRSHKVIVTLTVKEILTGRLRRNWCNVLPHPTLFPRRELPRSPRL